MMVCTPGTTESCYDGPGPTQDVGVCSSGTHTCDANGQGWSACEGQVVPGAEQCGTFLVDEDCDGNPKTACPTRVLMVSAAGDTYTNELVAQQQATGAFATVTWFDASAATPSLAELMAYDVLFVTSDLTFSDPVALGNVVADYYDLGGRVVMASFATTTACPILGRFGDPAQGYLLFQQTSYDTTSHAMSQIIEPQSPIMNGVGVLNGTFVTQSNEINGGVAVARFANGYPVAVRGLVKGRNRVDLNYYPPGSFCSGDCAALLRNALLYQ
jgi:hypothetical protein